MKTLVDEYNLDQVLERISTARCIGFDTETYGLKITDDMFALQLAIEGEAFYFNFHDYEDGTYVWNREEVLNELSPIIRDPLFTYFAHNFKFDLHRLANSNVFICGRCHCTQAVERILYNQHQSYSLDRCLGRRNKRKNPVVEEWIRDNHAWEWVEIPGKKIRQKNKFYWKVPFDIMFEYGCDDALDVLFLGMDQLKNIENQEVYERECKLVKTCLEVERTGVKVDLDYVKRGWEYEEKRLQEAVARATEQAGVEYKNGPKWLTETFNKLGQTFSINPDTGNPIFDKHALAEMESPIANTVKEIRRSEKYIGTYYSSFNHFANLSVLHANIRQAGTDTGRFSYSDPNLQQVPKEEKFLPGTIQVRKCFVPREGYCFVMIDFDQQEFRLMLDYAGQHDLIRDIMENGEDVHQATANMCGITRSAAKTLNFGLLYGMGQKTLAKSLDISVPEARVLKSKYFSRLPKVERLIEEIKRAALARGHIRTWAGRKLHFSNTEWVYKAPNHLIQGGCGDIAKEAMNQLSDVLRGHKSRMLIQVHDEIVFEVHESELDIVDQLKTTMENIYTPMNGMRLTCGVEHSWVSWGKQDVITGYPRIEISA